jgi:SAM-dependent methyltransferase
MTETKNLIRNCPVCDHTVGEKLHTQKFSIPEDHYLTSSYDVVSCIRCGFSFADTPSLQKDYDAYYFAMSKYEDRKTSTGGGENKLDKDRLNIAAEIIESNFPLKSASILDIGCANGGMLTSLKERGYSDLSGIDIPMACIQNVQALGFEAFFGSLFELSELKGKKYNIVILSHVLEHVKDLKEAVHNMKSLLTDDGIIYIEVPDASRYKDYFIVPNYYFDCEHINHFNIGSLNELFVDDSIKLKNFQERTMKVSNENFYPVVSAVYTKNALVNENYHRSSKTVVRDSIAKYVQMSLDHEGHSELLKLIQTNENVMVWGAGMYTLRLLQESPLAQCNIQCFLDKDSIKQGKKINEILILDPLEKVINDVQSTIIVASALHGSEILKEIRTLDGNDKRKVILL